MLRSTNSRTDRARRRRFGEAGQSLAEFAVVLFVLMLIVLGIIDLSRAVYARNVLANAAREGARYGVAHPDDTTGIVSRAKALVAGIDPGQVAVDVTRPDSFYIQVDATYTFQPVSGIIGSYLAGGSGNGSIVLRGRSRMRVE